MKDYLNRGKLNVLIAKLKDSETDAPQVNPLQLLNVVQGCSDISAKV